MTFRLHTTVDTSSLTSSVMIVTASDQGAVIRWGTPAGQAYRYELGASERALILKDCFDGRLMMDGVVSLLDCSIQDPIRLVAFMDHGRGIERPLHGKMAGVTVLRSPMLIENPDVMTSWVAGGLAENDIQVEELAAWCSRSESYQIIRHVLAQQIDAGVPEIAASYGLSVAQFYRKCRSALGRSLKKELRLLRAARALLSYSGSQHTFTRIAFDHGYASPSHFCTEIKSILGAAPSAVYRMTSDPS